MLSFLHITTIIKPQSHEYEHLRLCLSWSVTEILLKKQFRFTPHFQVQSSEQQSSQRCSTGHPGLWPSCNGKPSPPLMGRNSKDTSSPTRDHRRGLARSAAYDPKGERGLSRSYLTILFHEDQGYQLLTNIVKINLQFTMKKKKKPKNK